jgi:magnesium-transporting ATPase (P-type)
VLLRGAVLRNTTWCYGVVLFAGKDTKLMQNSGKTKFKRTSIDKLLNFIILGIVIFLLSMCLFCTVACGIWESMIGYNFKRFLPWDTVVPEASLQSKDKETILTHCICRRRWRAPQSYHF